MFSNLLKKLACLMFAGVMLGTTVVTEAATSGGKGTSYITVKTKANWYKSGQESITLSTNNLHVSGPRAIFKIYLDGRYIGTLGNPNLGKYEYDNGLCKILLKRNKKHTIKVVYDASATKKYYKKKSGRNMPNSVTPHWYVASIHKAECW